jgi:peptidoglycan/LPS O-acetylase OafA/YrhL
MTQPNCNSQRNFEVDGIRGWASLVVMLFHIFREVLGGVIPWVHSPLLTPFMDGKLPVLVFFVLSGDALSTRFFQNGSIQGVHSLLIKRYLRLTAPILLACSIVYLLMKTGLTFHLQAAKELPGQEWLPRMLTFDPSLITLFRYSVIQVYTNHSTETSYIPMLWTMSLEMTGSMLTFLFCYVHGSLRHPRALLLVLSCALMSLGSLLAVFFIGMLFSEIRANRSTIKIRAPFDSQLFYALLFFAALALFSATTDRHLPNPAAMFGACLLVAGAYGNNGLKEFFSNGFSKYLGEISFPLYLVHFPAIISIQSFLILHRGEYFHSINAQQGFAVIGTISALCSLLAAHVFLKVEAPMTRYLGDLANKLLKV